MSLAQPTYVMYETYTWVYPVPLDAGAEEAVCRIRWQSRMPAMISLRS